MQSQTGVVGGGVRKVALGLLMTVVVIGMLLALAGRFHAKVDTDSASAPGAGRTVGEATLVAARTIRVPAVETAVGSIRAVHETAVASKLLAKVSEVNVKAGQRVAKDDVLVRLDDADLGARLRQAAAAVDAATAGRNQAKIELERVEGLLARNAAAKIERDRADTALKAAEAELKRAEQARAEAETILDYATIRAPIAGVVIDKKVDRGDTVVPGQVLLTLYDPARMQLVARVRESLTHQLKVGQSIAVQVDALGKTCEGRVSEIVPEAEASSRTFSVKVTGPCPPGIYSGMFGRLLVPIGEQEVLVIPRAAVRRVGQLDTVDVAEGGALRRRAVQLGRDYPDGMEVLSGLKAGEQVAVPREHTAGGA